MMQTAHPTHVHLEKLEEQATTETRTYYQQMIGILIYTAISTRPNIAFSATRLSQYNNNPTEEHLRYAKYVLQYLKDMQELKIKYNGSSDTRLIGYSDSDCSENKDDHHSTSGHVFLMANGAIS